MLGITIQRGKFDLMRILAHVPSIQVYRIPKLSQGPLRGISEHSPEWSLDSVQVMSSDSHEFSLAAEVLMQFILKVDE